ncbi:OPT/YSL family transporter [Candidatus Uhrbacteria bacterium]|nr:OPT/YSL family transporter [Candidatus Uhrbacteria bacterium]
MNWLDRLKAELRDGDLNWRVLVMGALICAVATAAGPYLTLKLGLGVDLTYGGMFLAAAVLGHQAARSNGRMAIQLNLVQTMINVVSGVSFMVVILAAFCYIQNVFHHPIGFNPEWWQISLWLLVSANLGVFVGALPRRMILDDPSLPWPTGKAVQSVAETLTDPAATERATQRRTVLTVTTAVAAAVTFIRAGLNITVEFVGKPALGLALGLEFAGFGTGMLVPLSVGLSGLIGVWLISTYGETVGQLVALSGTAPEHWEQCRELIGKATVNDFLTTNCANAAKYLATPSHFKEVVQWTMWPATAMMVTAALTGVGIPLIRNWIKRRRNPDLAQTPKPSLADETIPRWWIWTGIAVCVVALVWLQDAWFSMPWYEVLVAVSIQPVLIIAGLRVLGITGTGPVSLMANATQFLFGLIWPDRIQQNLNAAHIAADPQASSESTIASFWVARRLGGKFRTLIVAQLLMIPIACLLLPVVFTSLEHAYHIGLEPGQLTAPTALKIASLAMVMEKGLSALPHGALSASIAAALLGIIMEMLLAVRKRDKSGVIMLDEDGNERMRFWWMPIPSAVGFALILSPSLTIAIALGSVTSAAWKQFSKGKDGAFSLFARPMAAGLIAGEAIIGGILIPILGVLVELLKPYL